MNDQLFEQSTPMELNELNTEQKEGKLLMAAVSMLTTMPPYDNMQPAIVMGYVRELAKEIYKPIPLTSATDLKLRIGFTNDARVIESSLSTIATCMGHQCAEEVSLEEEVGEEFAFISKNTDNMIVEVV